MKMSGQRIYRILLEKNWGALDLIRKFHVFPHLKYPPLPYTYTNKSLDTSLFLTTLPAKKRVKRSRFKIRKIPEGPLLISCKNSKLNHFKGMTYDKFDVIPLACKGWLHRKSRGDYFTILPAFEHTAFISSRASEIPKTFHELGISDASIKALKKIGVHNPTVIQAKAIQTLLGGENAILSAETGCGKTLAYLIPMLENILKFRNTTTWEANAPFGIILLPSKELTAQVGNIVTKLGSSLGLHCTTLISGDFDNIMKNPSVEVTDVIVTTLGIMMRYMLAKMYSTSKCRHLVLDEADIFFDRNFFPDLRRFLLKAKLNLIGLHNRTTWPDACQICLSSATMMKFAEEIESLIPVHDLKVVSTGYVQRVSFHVRQHFMRFNKSEKPEFLLKILKSNVKKRISTLVFCNRMATCHFLNNFLNENGVESAQISSDMFSEDRLKSFMNFKNRNVFVVICTDCMSRGLDMPWVKQVVNYEFPNNIASYIHRCGRIGRLGHDEDCLVTNFVTGRNEIKFVREIEMAARTGRELSLKYLADNFQEKVKKRRRRRTR